MSHPWELDGDRFSFADKRVLVTGGAGIVGFELVLQLLAEHGPRLVRLFDQNESALFFADQRLRAVAPTQHVRTRYLMGDVRDRARLVRAFEGIDVVLHTAALKTVRLCEYNPFEAVRTNLLGVQNVMSAALECGVKRVVCASSDQAVNPVNVVGASKLLAERLVSAAQQSSGSTTTAFTSVRFGEVLHKDSELIESLRDALQTGQPIATPFEDATRYLLPLGEAARLFLAAAARARGGEVFVVRMPAVALSELVTALAHHLMPGMTPTFKVEASAIGEKAYDELLAEPERTRCYETDDFIVIDGNQRKQPFAGAFRSDQTPRLEGGGLEAFLRLSGALS